MTSPTRKRASPGAAKKAAAPAPVDAPEAEFDANMAKLIAQAKDARDKAAAAETRISELEANITSAVESCQRQMGMHNAHAEYIDRAIKVALEGQSQWKIYNPRSADIYSWSEAKIRDAWRQMVERAGDESVLLSQGYCAPVRSDIDDYHETKNRIYQFDERLERALRECGYAIEVTVTLGKVARRAAFTTEVAASEAINAARAIRKIARADYAAVPYSNLWNDVRGWYEKGDAESRKQLLRMVRAAPK